MSLQVPASVTSAACPRCSHLNVLGDSGSEPEGGQEGHGASANRQPQAPPGKVLVACSSCAKQLFIPEGVSRFQVRAPAALGAPVEAFLHEAPAQCPFCKSIDSA